MLQQEIMSSLKTNEKNPEKYQQRFKDIKNQVEIIELKNAITKIKNLSGRALW